ncbi:MAG: hypothetical protein KatS3mg105_1879 [Gemmatales bacterium]|nr:MAG: hypothetical protein KatS3mg105_1879 [Gemmatales bacterium]
MSASSDLPQTSQNLEIDKGLPPVKPPSGRFLFQLFVIPFLIVLGVVGVIWFVTWLVGGHLTPKGILQDLRNANPEVRWRRASDLSQLLKRDDRLASDPSFALSVAELLDDALRSSETLEAAATNKPRSQKDVAGPSDPNDLFADPDIGIDESLRNERNFIKFLIACMGNFAVPVGAPLLNEIVQKEKPPAIPEAVYRSRRRLAVWALGNLGNSLKRLDRLSFPEQEAVREQLRKEVETAAPQRREWAKTALAAIDSRFAKQPTALGVDQALETAAHADDPALRKLAALALTFWQGNKDENERMENVLVELTRDDGHGAKDEERSLRAAEIRFQAVQALARRGSSKIQSRLPLLGEMLDEPRLAKLFQVKLKDGRQVADGALVGSVMSGALKSIAELAKTNPDIELSSLQPAIEKLANHDNPALRTEAQKTLLALKKR